MPTVIGLVTTKAFKFGDREFTGPGELFDPVPLGCGKRQYMSLLQNNYLTMGAIEVDSAPLASPKEPIAVLSKGSGWYEFRVNGETEKIQGREDLHAWMNGASQSYYIEQNSEEDS